VTRTGKYVAAGGVLSALIATVIGTWYALTRDIHTMKDETPDALPQVPALGKTGWKLVDNILPQLQSVASTAGVPLGLLVGWIAKESGGRLGDKTSLNELGLFQLMPAESQSIGVDHQRLSTDLDYSINAGILLIKKYMGSVSALGVAPSGSSYFWRLVKLVHSMGSGQVKKIVTAAKNAGRAASWEDLETFATSMPITGPQPKKWCPFVDKVYAVGRPFGFGSEMSAPALVGVACGFDILGIEST
jgi:hypothetical protein